MNLITTRLLNHHLMGKPFASVEEQVGWFGGIQAQDFAAAKWSLGLRLKNSTDSLLDQAFNEGKFLRTHVMRPTWHFVSPENIRWMLELTAPRVKTFMGHYNRKLELDEELFKKSNAAIIKILKKQTYATRQELKKELEHIGIKTDVQRLAHIVMWAELEQIICSGPRQGKQFTYGLLADRAPQAKKLDKDKALATLAEIYFHSHGPAQLKDFVWWSGLSVREATEGLEAIKSSLLSETINGKVYWFTSFTTPRGPLMGSTFLLSIFDEYTIGYTDRSDLSQGRDIERMISMGNALLSVLIINGKVAGTWKRIIKTKTIEITISPFTKLDNLQVEAITKQANRYSMFHNKETKLIIKY